MAIGTKEIATFADCYSYVKTYLPSITSSKKCITGAEVRSNLSSDYGWTNSGVYSNKQLVKYYDLDFIKLIKGITVTFTFSSGTLTPTNVSIVNIYVYDEGYTASFDPSAFDSDGTEWNMASNQFSIGKVTISNLTSNLICGLYCEASNIGTLTYCIDNKSWNYVRPSAYSEKTFTIPLSSLKDGSSIYFTFN